MHRSNKPYLNREMNAHMFTMKNRDQKMAITFKQQVTRFLAHVKLNV